MYLTHVSGKFTSNHKKWQKTRNDFIRKESLFFGGSYSPV